eukprot:1950389-Pyramimonas_sp.AAC.1
MSEKQSNLSEPYLRSIARAPSAPLFWRIPSREGPSRTGTESRTGSCPAPAPPARNIPHGWRLRATWWMLRATGPRTCATCATARVDDSQEGVRRGSEGLPGRKRRVAVWMRRATWGTLRAIVWMLRATGWDIKGSSVDDNGYMVGH